MRRITTTSTLMTILGLAVAVTVLAGAQARVRGTVKDSKGNPIKGATITLTSKAIEGYQKVVNVRDDGTFSFVILDATRHYQVKVEAPGFIPYLLEEFKVPVGSTDNEFDWVLKTQQEMQVLEQQKLMEQPGYKELMEGRELLEKGDKDGARTKLREAVSIMPDLLGAWTALAELDFQAGDYTAAVADAKKCLELDDEAVKCAAVAANASRELGDMEAHQKYLTLYQQLNPDDPATIFNEAAGYLNKMDDEHARPLLEKCLEVDPDFPKCLYEYGMLLLRSGDMAGAKEKLQRYLEVAPDGPDAATVTETLKYL